MLGDRWFPFFDVAKTLEEMDRAFGRMGRPLSLRSVPRGTFPAINIYEKDDGVVLTAEMPGVNADDIELTVQGDSVLLKGTRRADELSNGDRMYRRERVAGSFARTLALPEEIDSNSVKAEYRNGILRVQMDKAEKAKAKRIATKS
jgi:HSP20 family protein